MLFGELNRECPLPLETWERADIERRRERSRQIEWRIAAKYGAHKVGQTPECPNEYMYQLVPVRITGTCHQVRYGYNQEYQVEGGKEIFLDGIKAVILSKFSNSGGLAHSPIVELPPAIIEVVRRLDRSALDDMQHWRFRDAEVVGMADVPILGISKRGRIDVGGLLMPPGWAWASKRAVRLWVANNRYRSHRVQWPSLNPNMT